MTNKRPLRIAGAVLETGNLLWLRLLFRNRLAARSFPGIVYRNYVSLGGQAPWRSVTIFELLEELSDRPARIHLEHLPGEGVETPIDELAFLALVTVAIEPRCIFEIGTFRGRTALNFALNSPDDCRVLTLDLPPEHPGPELKRADSALVASRDVALAYGRHPAGNKVTQLYGNSMEFDFEPFEGKVDIVFVDGGHTYEIAASDTRNALRLCRPGGLVLWHDFANYGDYHDVTRAVLEVVGARNVAQIESTQLAAYRKPSR